MTRLNLLLFLAIVLLLLLSGLGGRGPISLGDTWAGLLGQGDDRISAIVWQLRLPRAMAALLTGAALGLSGAALQGLFQNPLAEPGILGVSASAALGAVIAIYFGYAALSVLAIPAAAILGSLAATLVLVLAAVHGVSRVTLLLVGIGLSGFSGALMSLALNLAPNPHSLADLVNWMMGSVANRSWPDLLPAAPGWIIGAGLILLSARGLRALSLGDETAASLGADPRRTRLLVITGTALLAGSSVAVAGTIGFVGIIAPHIVRPFVQHDPGRLLVSSALMGGCLLMAADLLVRVMPVQQELKLGVTAALVGAPVFIWIAARAGRALS